MNKIIEDMQAFFRGDNEYPLATAALILVIVAVYLLLFLLDPLNSLLAIPLAHLEPFLLNGWLVTVNGEFYRLFSAMFIHYHLAHLGSNLLFLLIYGLRYEELADSRLLLAVFLVSGLTGNIITVLVLPDIYSAGASGAIFGVFGALLVVLRDSYPSGLRTSIFTAFIFFTLTITSDTNVLAHGGGLIAGFALQIAFSRSARMKLHKRETSSWGRRKRLEHDGKFR